MNQVFQGNIGDCYFISVMKTVSTNIQNIKNVLVDNTEKNDAGIYQVRWYIRGKPWIVTVDDQISYFMKKGTDYPVYSRMNEYTVPS